MERRGGGQWEGGWGTLHRLERQRWSVAGSCGEEGWLAMGCNGPRVMQRRDRQKKNIQQAI